MMHITAETPFYTISGSHIVMTSKKVQKTNNNMCGDYSGVTIDRSLEVDKMCDDIKEGAKNK